MNEKWDDSGVGCAVLLAFFAGCWFTQWMMS